MALNSQVLRNSRVIQEAYKIGQQDGRLFHNPPTTIWDVDFKEKTYRKRQVVDFRWWKFHWQKEFHDSLWKPRINSEGVIDFEALPLHKRPNIYVSRIPRRHGKTWLLIFTLIELLLAVGHSRPIGAYYCVTRGQAVRNAWKIIEIALRNIPNVKIDKANGEITIPRPTLHDPSDYVTLYFFGITGGSGPKKGGYYDAVIFDEAEYMDRGFIDDVGIASSFDKDGLVGIIGTPDGRDNIDYWLEEAEKREEVAKNIKEGRKELLPKKIPEDVYRWVSKKGDCWNLGVYSVEKLMLFKAALPAWRFAKEFECKDTSASQAFFYRPTMAEIKEKGQHNFVYRVVVEERLPLWVHYDLGIGSKSDRMVFGVWQFTQEHMRLLAGRSFQGKGYADIVQAVRLSPYGKYPLYGHFLPHDAGAKEQSDGVLKSDKFREELRNQQVAGIVEVLPRDDDPLMSVGLVKNTLSKMIIDRENAADIYDGLWNHKKRATKNQDGDVVYENTPSKTKWRDAADMVKYAVLNWTNKYYQSIMPDQRFHAQPDNFIATHGKDAHLNSVVLNEDGSVKPDRYGLQGDLDILAPSPGFDFI